MEREEAAERIGRNYARFVKVYEGAEAPAAA